MIVKIFASQTLWSFIVDNDIVNCLKQFKEHVNIVCLDTAQPVPVIVSADEIQDRETSKKSEWAKNGGKREGTAQSLGILGLVNHGLFFSEVEEGESL